MVLFHILVRCLPLFPLQSALKSAPHKESQDICKKKKLMRAFYALALNATGYINRVSRVVVGVF